MNLDRKQLMIGGAGLALVLAFLWWRSRQQQATVAGAPTDTVGTTSGQEQSDYATLAGMLQQQQAQEAGDIGTLQGNINTLSGQETSDIAGITGTVSGLNATIDTLTKQLAAATRLAQREERQLTHVMAGQTKLQQRVRNLEHPKTGTKTATHNGDSHTNNHHPAGTGGKANGSRSHAHKGTTKRRGP